MLIATLFAIELLGFLGNPHLGILTYLILPACCALGLVLIPLGIVHGGGGNAAVPGGRAGV